VRTIQVRESGLPRIPLLRLSEKGYKQHSGGEFGWCRAGEIGRNTPLRQPGELRCRLLQGFSDSLRRGILRSSLPVRKIFRKFSEKWHTPL
jgi:hypothetical protein